MLRRLTASLALLLVVGMPLATQSPASSDLWSGTAIWRSLNRPSLLALHRRRGKGHRY
jgi:hypothetical protein